MNKSLAAFGKHNSRAALDSISRKLKIRQSKSELFDIHVQFRNLGKDDYDVFFVIGGKCYCYKTIFFRN
jgi:hypothetical protein